MTGGWAFGRSKAFANYSYAYEDYSYSESMTWKASHSSGWTVGAGMEYALTNNLSFKTEYLYVDLGSKSASLYDGGKSVSRDAKFHVVRAGLNYRFGWGSTAAPVVARY